jgi:uncharacterized short protein YbdD (DUF466 family)
VGDGEKLLTYLNSALKVLLGTDSFPRVPKKVKFCCPVKIVNTYKQFFTLFLQLTWLSQNPRERWRKLLTYLNSALKVLLGIDIFLRVPKKVKFCFPVKYVNMHIFSYLSWLSQKKPWVMEKNYLHI